MWNSSWGFCISPLSNSALTFLTGYIHGVHVLTSTRPHEAPAAQVSNDLCHTVSCISPEHQKAFTTCAEHALASAPTFLPQRSELLTGAFHRFFLVSPYSFYSLFQIQLLDDTWNRIWGGVKNWSSCTLMPLTYLVSIPKAQHLETTPRNSMNRNKKIIFLLSPIWQQN